MTKQTINVGTTDNDGTGSTIRAGGQIINANFTEIYSAIGDGTTLAFDVSGATAGQSLVYNASTNKFEPGSPTATSTFTIAGDGGSNQSITTGNTLTIQGGIGITTTGVNTDILSVAIDNTVATLTGNQTLTTKTISGSNNTLSNIGNSALTNSSISIGGITLNLGDTDATPALNLIDATNYPTSSLTGSITNNQLVNSTITIVDDSSTASTIDLGSTLKIAGSGVTTSISGDTLTITGATLSYSTNTFTGDGTTVGFTINSGRAVDDVLVFVNGICLVPTTDYTIASTTLTFQTAPAASAEIQVRYLPI